MILHTWASWFKSRASLVTALPGQAGMAAGGWLLGVTASIVQRANTYSGNKMELLVFQLLRIFLDMPMTDSETLTIGGYVAHDLTIKDTVIDFFTLLGVRIGKEDSKIAKLALRIDFESLCSDALGQSPAAAPPEGSQPSEASPGREQWESSSPSPEGLAPVLTVDFDSMQMLAPGVFLQIDQLHVVGFRVCEHAIKLSQHCEECCTRKRWLRTHKCEKHHKWLYECRECRHELFHTKMAEAMLYAQKRAGLLAESAGETVAGLFADIISRCVLMHNSLEFTNLVVKVDSTENAYPGSHFSAHSTLSMKRLRVEHPPLFGSHHERYKAIREESYLKALDYHLLHLPLELQIADVQLTLGRILKGVVQVNLYGANSGHNGDSIDAVTLKMRQDHWRFFNINGTVHQAEVLLGHTPQKIVLSTTKQGYSCVSPRGQPTKANEPVFTFAFCNILQNIAGNNTTLHRCYQNSGIGDEGEDDLQRLKDAHTKLLKRKETLEAKHSEIRQHLEYESTRVSGTIYAENTEPYSKEFQSEHGSESEQMHELSLLNTELFSLYGDIESSEFAQARFYQKFYWMQLDMKLNTYYLNVEPEAVSQTLMEIGQYSLEWLLKHARINEYGYMSADDWVTTLRNMMRSGIDTDGDMEVTHVPAYATIHPYRRLLDTQSRHVSQDEWDSVLGSVAVRSRNRACLKTAMKRLIEALQENDYEVLAKALEAEWTCFCTKLTDSGKLNTVSVKEWEGLEWCMEQANAKMEEHGCCEVATKLQQKLQQLRERTRVEAKPVSVLKEVVSLDAFLGVQLKLDLQLPMVYYFPDDSPHVLSGVEGVEIRAGKLSIECPATKNEFGTKISESNSQVMIQLQGARFIMHTYPAGTKEEVLVCPHEIVGIVKWNTYAGSYILSPSSIAEFDLDVFTKKESGKLCFATEPLYISLSPKSQNLTGRILAAATTVVLGVSDGYTHLKGICRQHLVQFVQQRDLMHRVYRQWLLPNRCLADFLQTVRISMNLRIGAFIAAARDSYVGTSAPEIESDVLEWDSEAIYKFMVQPSRMHMQCTDLFDSMLPSIVAKIDGIHFKFKDSDLEFQVVDLLLAVNLGTLRGSVNRFADMVGGQISGLNQSDAQGEFEETYHSSTMILVQLPGVMIGGEECPTCLSQRPWPHCACKPAALSVKVITAHNTLDGISFTMPSCRTILRHDQEEVIIDALALQLRMEGIAARLICGQYMDSEVADSMQMIQAVVMKAERDEERCHVKADIDTLTDSDGNLCASPVGVKRITERRGSSGVELQTAIAAVCKNETDKGDVTHMLQMRTALLEKSNGVANISLLVGEATISGRVSDRQTAAFLNVYTDASTPIWQCHLPLSSPNQVSKLLNKILENPVHKAVHGLARQGLKDIAGVGNTRYGGAETFNRFWFANCTVLVCFSYPAAARLVQSFRSIFAHAPNEKRPGKDHFSLYMHQTHFDIVNLWPTFCLLNRTRVVTITGYKWNWNTAHKIWWCFQTAIWFILTLDILPTMVAYSCWMSYSEGAIGSLPSLTMYIVLSVEVTFSALATPALFYAILGKWSRGFGIFPAVGVWSALSLLNTFQKLKSPRDDAPEIYSFPFGRNSADQMLACDFSILASLALALAAEVWSRVKMDGINTSKLRPPLDHRRPILMVACLYWLVIGAVEVAYILTTKQLNDSGVEVDWVWPPDEADCNKVLLLCSAMIKVTAGVYLFLVFVLSNHWDPLLDPCVQHGDTALDFGSVRFDRCPQTQGPHKCPHKVVWEQDKKLRYMASILIGFITCEVVIAIMQQYYTVNILPQIGLEGSGFLRLTSENVVKNPLGGNLCALQNSNLVYGHIMFLWLFGLLILRIRWMFQRHQETYTLHQALLHIEQYCGRWEHRPEHQRRLQRVMRKLQLVDSAEGDMREMGKPPPLSATHDEWLKWIEDSGAAVTSLTRTLALPDPEYPELGDNGRGKLAAIQTAKTVIYGANGMCRDPIRAQASSGSAAENIGDFFSDGTTQIAVGSSLKKIDKLVRSNSSLSDTGDFETKAFAEMELEANPVIQQFVDPNDHGQLKDMFSSERFVPSA